MRLWGRSETEIEKEGMPSRENPLYMKICSLPSGAEMKQGRLLVLSRPKVDEAGEDFFLAIQNKEAFFLGVFDGCGGSGAKIYPAFGNHTGAWVAARAAASAAREWFTDDKKEISLEAGIAKWLQDCKTQSASEQMLLGSLSREFPTTVAAFTGKTGSDEVDFYWCGDSRCYILDQDGLHQITMDDSSIHDAMRNLREDAPMTNVACASRSFQLHHVRKSVPNPSLIFAATDGCFGYLPSPMAFERLLIETVYHALGMRHWKQQLDRRLRPISGDDYTLVAWPHGFDSFETMRQTFVTRLRELRQTYPEQTQNEEALFAQWERYRSGYEQMLAVPEKGGDANGDD